MKLMLTFRHQDSEDSLRDYVKQKIDRLAKYFHRPVEANVVFSLEKHRHTVEITISADQTNFAGKETANDAEAAFDLCFNKVEKQARKYRDRMKQHRGREGDVADERAGMIEKTSESPPEPSIIRSERYVAKPLSIEDAILLLKENHDDFIVFRNADSEKVSVLYRRKDRNFGLIEPE